MHVWWPNLDIDIESKVRTCTACQHMQSSPPTTSANPWIWPSKPWQRIHIDFAGPFLGEMFLIVVDTYSKWMEVVRMTSTTSENTINVLRTLFSSHGIPNYLVSDNTAQFTGAKFQTFLKKNGIKHILSAPYHPSSNGEAERAVRTFKTAMKTMKEEKGTLSEKIARFLLKHRTTPRILVQKEHPLNCS
jgi:transposase InsO family protein